MGQRWKISSIEDQIFSFLDDNIPVLQLEETLIQNIKSIQIAKILTSIHFFNYHKTNKITYDFKLLKLELLNQYESLYLLNVNSFYIQVVSDYYQLIKHNNFIFLIGFIEIAKLKLVFIIDHTLKSYRKKGINNVIDYLILFHVDKSTKLINQFKTFLKLNFSYYDMIELKVQFDLLFHNIGSENIIKIHKKEDSILINYTKNDLLKIIDEINNFKFNTLTIIKECEKMLLQDICSKEYYEKIKTILLIFFQYLDKGKLGINIDEITIFLNDLLITEDCNKTEGLNMYYFSNSGTGYFSDDIETKLNLILKDNKNIILHLFSSIQAAKKERSEKLENLKKFGTLLSKYFKIDIPDNTLRNILESYQMSNKEKELIENLIDDCNLKL